MVYAIKKQLKDYQSWIDLATQKEADLSESIGRYDFVTFIFVFTTILFTTFILFKIHLNLSIAVLIMHLFLGVNILKARTIVANSLNNLENHKEITTDVAMFLNREYSLFLVAQGKSPLTDVQIENLEVHKKTFVKNQMTRAGRGDSIKRFRLAFLKKEKNFFNILFGVLVIVEFFVVF